MIKIKCFEAWAGSVFLGYEYAEDTVEAIIKTRQKFDSPQKWNVNEYTVKQLTKETEDGK